MVNSDWRTYEWSEDPKDVAWREFAQPGQRIPLLWDDGVTLLEIASVAEDGTIEVRSATPE